jgi:hypothetical protein
MASGGLGTVIVQYADGVHLTFGEVDGATFSIENGVLLIFDGDNFISAIAPSVWDAVEWHGGEE